MLDKRMVKMLDVIARETMGIETLERRWSDSLDFYEVSVWELQNALHAAYLKGLVSRRK